MVTETVHVGGGDDEVQREEEEEEREVERYGEQDQPDVFGELLRRAGGEDVPLPPVQRVGQVGGLTDEQRERIRKNKELAAQRKKEKQEREQREAEEELRSQQMGGDDLDDMDEIEREMMSAPAATEWSQDPSEKVSKDVVESNPASEGHSENQDGEQEELNRRDSGEETSKSLDGEKEKNEKPATEEESEEVMGLDEMLEQMDED